MPQKHMPRPSQIPLRSPLLPEEIRAASYVGSPEHKANRWWGGLPGARVSADGKPRRPGKQNTTLCPLLGEDDQARATGWVRCALEAGQYRYFEGDGLYPKHIWYKADGNYWFGFAVNQTAGTYKGWPISEVEKFAAFD